MIRTRPHPIQAIILSPWYLPTVMVFAFALRLCWILLFRPYPLVDFAFYFRSAESIAQGFGYSAHGTATAYFPIGYPLFLSILFRVFGVSLTAALTANLLCSIASFFFAYWIARFLFHSELAGRLFLLLFAVYPNNIAYTSLVSTEIFYLFLVLVGVVLLLPTFSTNGKVYPVRMLTAGIVLGVATLVKVQTLLLPAILLLVVPRFSWGKKSVVNQLERGAVLYAGLLLVLCPWIIRNAGIYNDVVLSNNGGTNLYIGNGPGANGTWIEPPVFDTTQGVLHDYRNDQEAKRKAVAYMRTHPWRTMTLLPEKFNALFSSGDGVYWNTIGLPHASESELAFLQWVDHANATFENAVLVLFAASLLYSVWKKLTQRRTLSRSPLSIAVILYFVAIYLVYYGSRRYSFPIMPWMIMYSAALPFSLRADVKKRTTFAEEHAENEDRTRGPSSMNA